MAKYVKTSDGLLVIVREDSVILPAGLQNKTLKEAPKTTQTASVEPSLYCACEANSKDCDCFGVMMF